MYIFYKNIPYIHRKHSIVYTQRASFGLNRLFRMYKNYLPLILLSLTISEAFIPETNQHEASKDAYKAATDLNGRAVPSLTSSLTVGKGQHILLQDVNLLSHLAHFDRERIPERVVHTKGAGAHGHFTVTHDITKYTKASVFSEIGKRTDVFVRFSTVTGESGSADTVNNPRGFSTKFYTEDGNWDLVGNNINIFPIRDPILFPSFIHSQKRHPSTHLKDNNAIWDFFSLRPESTHFALQVSSDLGFPDGYRFMNGGGIHTFKFVNETGSPIYVKFHWRSNQGNKNLTIERATCLAGSNPDYATQDLYEAIARGEFPSWKLYIQLMTFEEAATYKYNPFDATKIWLEEDFPLRPVGEMVLNRNPVDYFAEVEQSAFDPGSLVPGIEFSPDPLLLGRCFSYLDALRYRLGVNFLQLPINSPKNKIRSYQRDGRGAIENGDGGPNYYPNSYASPKVSHSAGETVFKVSGDVARADTGDDDNFSQPRIFLNSLSQGDRERLVKNLAVFFDGVRDGVRARSIQVFKNVDEQFGAEVNKAVDRWRISSDSRPCRAPSTEL